MMLKFFIFFLFLLPVGLFAQNIIGTQKIPATALPGTEFTVETTINKGAIKNFMKFFQEIPEGLVASEIESQGGTFTFADGGAKIVWISPPSDEIFVIKYKITVNGGVSGTKKLPAKISYIDNNERKVFDFPIATIIIGTTTPVKKEIPSTNPTISTQPIKTAPVATTPITTTTPVKKETPASTTPTQPTTFSKVPTTALPSSSGKMYRVQIGAFSAKPKIDGVPEVTTLVLENGITKYFSGNYSTYEEALKRKKEMVEKGFQGAFIVAFEGDKIVK